MSDSSPDLHLTYGVSGFLTLPPGQGRWAIRCVAHGWRESFLSASMTLHSAEMCEYWVPWQ